MKAAAISFCLAVTLAQIVSAQDAVTPASHIKLFNGKDFDGWTFCMRNDADPTQTWSVTNGVIHCNGSAIGYLRTKQSYSNYVVTVEWRFIKVTPKANNTGVLVHMQLPDAVWPVCIQNQGKSDRQGDLFVMMGAECKEHKGMDKNTPVPMRFPSNENPVGEWDTNVTICAGNDVKAIINGKFMNEITECTISSGYVGIQSEGGDIEIRKIYLEPLNQPDEFFKVITDAETGQYAAVNSEKITISLKDKNGNTIWATDVVKEIESPSTLDHRNNLNDKNDKKINMILSNMGDRKISSMQFSSNLLTVQIGQVSVTLEKRTGKIVIITQD